MRQFREKWVAGAYEQMTGTNAPSSLTGLNASSQSNLRDLTLLNVASLASLTPSSLTGAAGYRGIATMNSGTSVVSVTATAAISGAVIQTTIYMYSTVQNSVGLGQTPILAVQSVRAGAFEIVTVGSNAPTANMPVAWFVIR
mgnify:CR=1 FL=1